MVLVSLTPLKQSFYKHSSAYKDILKQVKVSKMKTSRFEDLSLQIESQTDIALI